MALKPWNDVADPLAFEINGKTYVVPPISLSAAQELSDLCKDEASLEKATQVDLFKLAMTEDLWAQLTADDVPRAAAWRAGLSALADVQQGRTVAEAVWETGMNPSRLAAFMAARQETVKAPQDRKPKGSKRSRSSVAAGASTASMSGTNSRPVTKP